MTKKQPTLPELTAKQRELLMQAQQMEADALILRMRAATPALLESLFDTAPRMLNKQDAIRYVGCSQTTFDRYRDQGDITHKARHGRKPMFAVADLDRLLAEKHPQA